MLESNMNQLLNDNANADKVYDCVMVGAGPAALAAAVYTARENIETVLYERGVIGGLAAVTDKVDNYPGFADGVSGLELAAQLQAQAERFGAQIRLGEVTGVQDQGDWRLLSTDSGDVRARTVLIATGSDYKKLGVPGEAEYYGRGVHYCATCDGAFYRDKRLVVVGGGNSAVQEALFLTRFASHIDMLVRSRLKASRIMLDELARQADKITVHLEVTTDQIVGDQGGVVKVVGTQNGQRREYPTDGVFVFIGLKPNTEFLRGSPVAFDQRGLIMTDDNLMTAVNGVFAAGDVRSGATMQIASAVGEGATAALKIREFLDERSRQASPTSLSDHAEAALAP